MSPRDRVELHTLQAQLDTQTARTRELLAQLDAYTPRTARRRTWLGRFSFGG